MGELGEGASGGGSEGADASDAKSAQRPLTAPRPGHADLAGALKFDLHDARYILERASARETAARVAAGAFAKLLLREFGVTVLSHSIAVGHVRLEREASWAEIEVVCSNLDSPLRCVDAEVEARMKAEVDHVLRAGDSVGGTFEVVARGVPPGLGSHAQWDEKLDARLARAVMSIQAVKAVELGTGIANAGAMVPKCRTKSAMMLRGKGSIGRQIELVESKAELRTGRISWCEGT